MTLSDFLPRSRAISEFLHRRAVSKIKSLFRGARHHLQLASIEKSLTNAAAAPLLAKPGTDLADAASAASVT